MEVCLMILCSVYISVAGGCTNNVKNVFNVCGQAESSFTSKQGSLSISAETTVRLLSCTCEMVSSDTVSDTLVLAPLDTWQSENTSWNVTISYGNQTLPGGSSAGIFTPPISDGVTLSVVRGVGSGAEIKEIPQICFGFTMIKGSQVTVSCSATFLPPMEIVDEAETISFLGVIIGPTVVCLILLNIASLGLLYVIMRRTMKSQVGWRPRIQHAVVCKSESANDNETSPGNSYVGIPPSPPESDPQTLQNPQPPVDTYEDVGEPEVTGSKVLLPGKSKKSRFSFWRERKIQEKSRETKPESEVVVDQASQGIPTPINFDGECYENINEQKNHHPKKMKKKKVAPKQEIKSEVVQEIEWTPADEYEEVQFQSTESSAASKSKYRSKEETVEPNNGMAFKAYTSTQKNITKHQKPTECYETMSPPNEDQKPYIMKPRGANRGNSAMTKKPPNSEATGSDLTKHQIAKKQKQKPQVKAKPSGQMNTRQGFRPTENYDNVERTPDNAEKAGRQRFRTQTQPSETSSTYDNFDEIDAMRRRARAESDRANR